jgi:hypothetical protein
MKTKFLSGLFVMLSVFMASTFCACSNDDDETTVSGEAQVLEIMNAVDGQISNMLVYENEEDIYYIEAEKLDAAAAVAKTLTAQSWDGKATTIKLNDNCGTIKINQSNDETVYYDLFFSFSKTSFSEACSADIKVVNPGFFSVNNAETRPVQPRKKTVFSSGSSNGSDDSSSNGSNNNSNNNGSTSGN